MPQPADPDLSTGTLGSDASVLRDLHVVTEVDDRLDLGIELTVYDTGANDIV
jgi:hypothetical protein